MQNEITLTKKQASQVMLASLGLLSRPTTAASKADLMNTIRQIHNLQIDTISVVARAHLHILWSRVGNYPPSWLEELHGEGHLFEQFVHALCLLPIEDYPLFRAHMLNKLTKWEKPHPTEKDHAATLAAVLAHIRQNGEARSADFENTQQRGGWWDWKAEKIALEHLTNRGDLMVSRRINFQRVYNLRERVLPEWDDTLAPDYPTALLELTQKAFAALGVANTSWAANYFYLKKSEVAGAISQLIADGVLLPARIDGLGGERFFFHTKNASLLEAALADQLCPSHTTVLSPFDPLVSDRTRSRELFDFDYSIECYTPAAKRKFGYFVLPILHQGRLIGRMDAKAWRKEGRLQVIRLYLEPGVEVNLGLTHNLAETLQAFAAWQGLSQTDIDWTEPKTMLPQLQAILGQV